MSADICFAPATEQLRLLRTRAISCVELMAHHLDQIERANERVNAIVTLDQERAMTGARAADAALARGETPGLLHGLPIAHKDLTDTAGMRTTYGSPLYADHVPQEDALIVERLRDAGAITIGKTNTPEFGAGSQTFNPVFGATRNPYALDRTCGGSSGGAAVALACGMQPLADGSDMGGSLRNPAAFCNVVGLRPAPGRVPRWPSELGWATLGVAGPMARTVGDVALMLAAIAGDDARSPIALESDPGQFLEIPPLPAAGVRVAWSRDLGGLPVDPRITAVLEEHRATFAALGCRVEDAEPDFADADRAFKVWRAWHFASQFAPLLEEQRDALKDTVVWNAEAGLKLSAYDLAVAEQARTRLYHRLRAFMARYDYLICPVTQVPPFDVDTPYVTEINGEPMETYIDWMRSCYYISVVGLPAISIPCGFTEDGLPVGIQIVGRHRAEREVLALAQAFEAATGYWRRRPGWLV